MHSLQCTVCSEECSCGSAAVASSQLLLQVSAVAWSSKCLLIGTSDGKVYELIMEMETGKVWAYSPTI